MKTVWRLLLEILFQDMLLEQRTCTGTVTANSSACRIGRAAAREHLFLYNLTIKFLML